MSLQTDLLLTNTIICVKSEQKMVGLHNLVDPCTSYFDIRQHIIQFHLLCPLCLKQMIPKIKKGLTFKLTNFSMLTGLRH